MTRRDYLCNTQYPYLHTLRRGALLSGQGDQEMTGHSAAKASRAGGSGCMPCSRRLALLAAAAYAVTASSPEMGFGLIWHQQPPAELDMGSNGDIKSAVAVCTWRCCCEA